MDDVAKVVTLIGVNPAEQHQHSLTGDVDQQCLATMAGGGRRGEAR